MTARREDEFVVGLREVVTPDDDGDNTGPNVALEVVKRPDPGSTGGRGCRRRRGVLLVPCADQLGETHVLSAPRWPLGVLTRRSCLMIHSGSVRSQVQLSGHVRDTLWFLKHPERKHRSLNGAFLEAPAGIEPA